MNRVLSFTESAVLSYGPALATAIIPINIDSRHISRVRNSESVPERFNSDLILAKSSPSRSKDKAGLTARTRRRFQDLLAVRRRRRRRRRREVELEATGSISRGVYLCVASHDEDKAGCTWAPSSRSVVTPGGLNRG
ncbi:hypothetical protein ALC53_12944 [Atta colombica]|uniref:Uncharacterized protein n=1 Tax=Atta colombica TaxID=520822 RepID=A0A151HZ54_9HYME|nr:hypothetical protein ALC53_12944 [Atta colombica]